MTTPLADRQLDWMAHIHMLGCQALTEARNLGYAEAKGTKEDDGDLLDMIEKHEELLEKEVNKFILQQVLDLISSANRTGEMGVIFKDELIELAKQRFGGK